MNATTSQIARSIRSHWRDGQTPDTLAAIADNPDLGENRSAILDLAYRP